MRTFPGAWVLPGGSVDAGDGSTLNAALRELAEETGLTPTPAADGEVRDTTPLAFGNWQRGYVIGDRTKLNVLRDPYTTKGIIKWYFRKRVHGSVLNSEAIKLLRVSAE